MARMNETELVSVMDTIIQTYDGSGDDFKVYVLVDEARRSYAVTGIGEQPTRKQHSFILIQARIIGDYIIVDEDKLWDKQLWKALEKAGVPREQIILAYLGEKLPEASGA